MSGFDFSERGKIKTDAELQGSNVKQSNMDATIDPAVSNDITEGYEVGSRWVNVTSDKEFVCLDASSGAAVWKETTSTGGSGDVVGPGSAVDENIAVFDSTTGKLIKDSGINQSAVTANTAKVTNATHTGDVAGDTALTIGDDKVTYAKMQNVVADDRILGNVSGAGGAVAELAKADVLTMINVEDGADATDATNVAAAGAVMDSDISEAEGFMRKTGAGAYEAIKTNLAASVAPAVGNDNTQGYAVGSRWIDTTADKEYVCLDAATGSAVWTETTGSGGGSSPLTTKGDLFAYTTVDARLPVGATNGHVLTVDSAEAAGMKWAAGGGSSLLTEFSDTAISASGMVNEFNPTDDGFGYWEFMVEDGTNFAQWTVHVVWDDSAGTVSYRTAKTNDIGDTSGITFTADMSGATGTVRLMATRTSGTWNVYGVRYNRIAS